MRAFTGPLAIVAVAAIAAAAVTVIPETNVVTGTSTRTAAETVPLDGATAAEIHVQLDAGELWLSGGSMAVGTVVDRTELLRGTFEIEGDQVPAVTYEVDGAGRTGQLVMVQADPESLWNWSKPEQRWRLFLNPTIPTSVSVEMGTGNAELLVGGMRLTELQIEHGSGDLVLDLTGDWRSSLEGMIEVGAGDITIRAPRETGVKITAEQGVGSVRGSDFVHRDGAYVNAAYGRTAYQIEIEIDQGAGFIDLSEM